MNKHLKRMLYILIFLLGLLILIEYFNMDLVIKEKLNRSILPANRDLNIIFIETNQTKKWIDLMQMCAIESAALNNPQSNVYLYSLNAELDRDLARKYDNIIFSKENVEVLFYDTPLYSWWLNDSDIILTSKFVEAHLADALRLALLYKYGGIYSDLDTIAIRSFKPLSNFIGVGYLYEEEDNSIGNGFLIFPKKHSALLSAMNFLAKHYNPNNWSLNGPKLLKKIIKEYCNATNIFDSLIYGSKKSECDVTILPQDYFYPYSWEDGDALFKPNSQLDIKRFINTYSVHFYGNYIRIFNVTLNGEDYNVFDFFSSFNCPLSYKKLLNKKD